MFNTLGSRDCPCAHCNDAPGGCKRRTTCADYKKFEERKAVHHDEQKRRRDGIDAAYQVRFANYIRPGIER